MQIGKTGVVAEFSSTGVLQSTVTPGTVVAAPLVVTGRVPTILPTGCSRPPLFSSRTATILWPRLVLHVSLGVPRHQDRRGRVSSKQGNWIQPSAPPSNRSTRDRLHQWLRPSLCRRMGKSWLVVLSVPTFGGLVRLDSNGDSGY
jgi:hypothetical protein